MSDKTNRLAAELQAIRAEIVELESVEEPTDEQAERAEALLADWDAKKAEHDKSAARDAKVAAVREAALDPANVERGTPFSAPAVVVKRSPFEDIDAVGRGFVPADDMVARAATAIEEHTVRGVSDLNRQRVTELVERNPMIARHVLLTGSPAYFDAFKTVLRYGPEQGSAMLTDEQRYAMRAALSNTDANGGYTNPWMIDPQIILTNDGIAGPIRSISRVEVGTTEYWNGITSAGVTAEWLAEGSQAADASPTVGQPSILTVKGAAYIFASYEQEADGQLVSQLPRLIADAKERLEEAAFATGTGSTTDPKGIVTAVTAVTTSRVSPTTGGAFSAATEVYKVANAVPPRHASRASWIANKTTINAIRQFDVYGGSSFIANLAMGQPPLLLGQPLYEVSTMTATVTTGSNILLAGDFSEYLIYDRIGTTMKYVDVVVGANQRPTGQSGWFAFWRTGADCLNPNAFRVLKL